MEFSALLEQKRDAIVEKWFDSVIRTYPPGSSEFLAKRKDRFQNPVGHTIKQSVGSIYDQIISAMDEDDLRRALDGIIRIRTVQDFTASEAVAFVFELKNVINARARTFERIRGSRVKNRPGRPARFRQVYGMPRQTSRGQDKRNPAQIGAAARASGC